MVGVDEFRNRDQARQCSAAAKDRLQKISKIFVPAIVLSVISPLLCQAAFASSLKWLTYLLIIINIVVQVKSGAMTYIVKYMTIPFRHLGILGILPEFCWLTFAILLMTIFPIALIGYAKYLCNITVESAKDIVG